MFTTGMHVHVDTGKKTIENRELYEQRRGRGERERAVGDIRRALVATKNTRQFLAGVVWCVCVVCVVCGVQCMATRRNLQYVGGAFVVRGTGEIERLHRRSYKELFPLSSYLSWGPSSSAPGSFGKNKDKREREPWQT